VKKSRKSLLGIVMTLFPVFALLLILGSFGYCVLCPGIASVCSLIFALYGFPLLCFRLHQWIWPVQEGISPLIGTHYVPWYGSHQIQLIYIAFPAIEALLRLIPGVFSLWLRAWGSRVGRAVYWTPTVEILDRSLLVIGDQAVFGHRCGMSSHIITPRDGNLSLYIAKVSIGHSAFVGGGSYLGPGVLIEDGALVPAGHNIRPRQRVTRSQSGNADTPAVQNPL
jgi:hypothetical protein